MNIANPIYDVVFKYLMDDKKIAKKLLSLILDENIIELDFKPTERRSVNTEKSFTVLHMDFAATIKLEDGTFKQVIIELQKAKFYSDIMRFRRYLGNQYSDKNNTYDKDGKTLVTPILSVYFLGYALQHVKAPVIKVKRDYQDAISGESIKDKEEFIEALTHDSVIIQIPYLKQSRQVLLTKVLSVFNLSNNHFININEDDYPDEYKEVIRRLLKAAAESQIRENMDVEDDVYEGFGDLEREIASKVKDIEDKKKVIEDKKKVIEDKEKVIEDKEKVIEDKEKVIEDKDKIIEDKDKIIINAQKNLVEKFNISQEEALKILQGY